MIFQGVCDFMCTEELLESGIADIVALLDNAHLRKVVLLLMESAAVVFQRVCMLQEREALHCSATGNGMSMCIMEVLGASKLESIIAVISSSMVLVSVLLQGAWWVVVWWEVQVYAVDRRLRWWRCCICTAFPLLDHNMGQCSRNLSCTYWPVHCQKTTYWQFNCQILMVDKYQW